MAASIVVVLLAAQILQRSRGSDIQTVLDLSQAAPVEYRADVFFRLLDADKGPRGQERKEALESLFQSAGQARQPLPVGSPKLGEPTPDSTVAYANRLGLDRISIRCRVVREIAKTDRSRARALFRETYRDLRPVAGGCKDSLVLDVSGIEAALREVLVGLEGDALAEELFEYARAIASGVQIPGLVQVVLTQAPAASEPGLLFALSSIVSGRLQQLEDGDREFVYATGPLRLIERVAEFAGRVRQAGFSDENLWASLRRYLARHLTGKRCADTAFQSGPGWRSGEEMGSLFNRALSEARARVEPLSERDRRPSEVIPVEGGRVYYSNARAKPAGDCIEMLVRLREEDPRGERRSEWSATLDKCLTAVRYLAPAGADEERDVVREKVVCYRHIFDKAPGWWEPRVALDEAIAVFENTPLKSEAPMAWLWLFHLFLDLGRELSEEKRGEFERLQKRGVVIPGLPGPHGQAIWERVRGSKDPVVALYGMLESVAPLKWGAWRAL